MYMCMSLKRSYMYMSFFDVLLQVHAFEKPHRCQICNVAFRQLEQLERHQLSDTHQAQLQLNQRLLGLSSSDNPRPYHCPECHIGFR